MDILEQTEVEDFFLFDARLIDNNTKNNNKNKIIL